MHDRIHVSRNKDSLGVFSEDQLRMAIGRGSVYASDFCWKAGMKEWVTIGMAYPHLIPATPATHQSHPPFPVAAGLRHPPVNSTMAPSAPMATGHAQSHPGLPTAGDRFCAYLLDGIFMIPLCCVVLSPILVVFAVIADASDMNYGVRDSYFRLFMFGMTFLCSVLYYGILGNTSQKATWGQRIMGFKMADARTGAAPTSGQVWRWALYRGLLTSCCGCIGLLFFIPILSDSRK